VPHARAVHHEQGPADEVPASRVAEVARNRDRYMRKHHTAAAARMVRWLTALGYAERALTAAVLPGRDARGYARRARASLLQGGPGPRR
jgi:hypothetical protein